MSLAIAITPRNEVAGHFGKAAAFLVFDEQGQPLTTLDNAGRREIGCKHKKRLQHQLSELGVSEIILGNVGQRSLARLLKAGFSVIRVPTRSSVSSVLNGDAAREQLATAEQGRPCKREKGDCGCGCGSKKQVAPAKIGTAMNKKLSLSGLTKVGGLKL
ncbi:NifB/NifX family molybdenum-iron cluster-binding protein [Photobacterium chitinilyticum]|uniref:Dinitrogenase iron-molybdenum cofactor biosynthesis domain-containing protein n=1 Tax=Photobacterium chitinilyticum TaxID=2485123 RepID=A0A3S3REL1_9GAMM|nr:NifB/NifX family molybdenum-iron cluster-binding protein [Photobacterium chitinilyticum]RWX53277.1 hypothetical protein EDI28_22780 [Photobacterium chitinilyticum]